jgi:hypothetical protein
VRGTGGALDVDDTDSVDAVEYTWLRDGDGGFARRGVDGERPGLGVRASAEELTVDVCSESAGTGGAGERAR